MALSGLKPPAQLNLEDNVAINWRNWLHAYELYATAAGVITKSEKVQCAVFLHVAGLDAQKVARTLNIDSADRDKIAPLVEAFRNYCEGKDNITVVRYRFNSYNQVNESMETYIRELRNRITHCEYGVLEDSLLRDRLVCGVKDNELRSRLLQTPCLTLTQCIEMCRLNEHKSEQLHQSTDEIVDAITRTTPTNSIATQRPRSTWIRTSQPTYRSNNMKVVCTRCGYNHGRGLCPARDKQCAGCGRLGHFVKMCKASLCRNAPINEINIDRYHSYDVTPETDVSMTSDPDLFVGTVLNINNNDDNLWYVTETIGEVVIKFKLDTGSEANLIPRAIFDKLKGQTLTPPTCGLVTYTGQRIQPEGEANIRIGHHTLKFQVTTSGSPILGKDACVKLNLINRINELTTRPTEPSTAEEMVNKYKDVFTGLGLIKSNAKIYIDNTVPPVIDPPRRIPHAIFDQVKKELDRMVNLGVIVEQTEPTSWVSSITIVHKPNKI